MIYGIKLLFPILLLWALSLATMKVALRDMLTPVELRSTMTVVLVYVVVSFLSYRPELFALTCAIAVIVGQQLLGGDVRAKLAAFWMAAILFPPLVFDISGVAGINYLIKLNHFRIASICLLLPAAFRLMSMPKDGRRSTRWLDIAVMSYPVFCVITFVPSVPFTTTVRSIVELILDVVLPYYVFTRGIRNWVDLKFVLTRLLLACIFAASVALLEAAVRKNIYSELQWVYAYTWSLTHTLMRGGLVRVTAMTSQPIILAMQILFTIGLWSAITRSDIPKTRLLTVLGALLLALVCTWSRGPLLGTMIFALGLGCLYKFGPRVFGVFLVISIAGAVAINVAGLDAAAINVVKNVLSTSQEDSVTIDYRGRLLDTSLDLIKQSPWIGVRNYAAYMQDLVQGEGIIDLVNTYIVVMLNAGVVGLAMFLSPFVMMTVTLLRRLGAGRASLGKAEARFFRVFVALTIACLVTIFTTSIFELVPFLLMLLVAAPGVVLSFDPARAEEAVAPAPPADPLAARRGRGMSAAYLDL